MTLQVRRSRRLAGALLLAHLFAAAALWPTLLPVWAKVAASAGLAASFGIMILRRYPEALVLKDDGGVELVGCGINAGVCRVHPATTVFPGLIVLLLDSSSGRIALALPVDALGKEGHRHLRTWLKWKGKASGPAV